MPARAVGDEVIGKQTNGEQQCGRDSPHQTRLEGTSDELEQRRYGGLALDLAHHVIADCEISCLTKLRRLKLLQ